ncbi:hypothetical protein LguiB_022701 [Lonicera macranthoides]
MTPEEIALALKALRIDQDTLIYIAAGATYGGKRRLVKKEALLPPSELTPFQNHSSQIAALYYIVSLESDIFIPTYKGNMARVIEGHRHYIYIVLGIQEDDCSGQKASSEFYRQIQERNTELEKVFYIGEENS